MNGWRSRFRPPLTNPLGIKLTVSILVGESNHIMGRTSPTYRPPAAFYGPCETARISVYILRESSSTSMLILFYALCRMFLQKVDLAAIRYRRWVGPLCHRELIEVRWRNCNALHQFLKIECKWPQCTRYNELARTFEFIHRLFEVIQKFSYVFHCQSRQLHVFECHQ